MKSKTDCTTYLYEEKSKLINDFPKFENTTKEIFTKLLEFINTDFNGVSENKIYRKFLITFKEIICCAFENNASKAYMQSLFIKINNKKVSNYLISLTKTNYQSICNILKRFVNLFVYWQNSEQTKEFKLNEILNLIDSWM